MSCSIISRKTREDGRSIGYLLNHDGMALVVEERDLYAEEILKGLIDEGYEFHDYYGDITNPEGIKIKDLPVMEADPSDNDSFAGLFAEDALTEQQCMRFFKINMKEIQEIEFHAPIRLEIKTREELLSYLKRFKQYYDFNKPIDSALPINAIAAREALFSIEEIEQNPEIIRYFEMMSKRRRFVSTHHIKLLEDELIAAGLMKEEQRGDKDALMMAYTAFGPEGIKDSVISKVFEQDVAYNINTPYSGSGREKNTFDAEVIRIRRDGINDSMSRLRVIPSFVLMTKNGDLIHNGEKFPRTDVIGGTSRLFVDNVNSVEMKKQYKAADTWKTECQIVKANYVEQMNRISMVIQLTGGQIYEWRCDLDRVALVSMTNCVFIESFGSVMTANGIRKPLIDVYGTKAHDKFAIFNTLQSEMLDSVKEKPMFENTLKMCEYCGLTVEQALDYTEVRHDRYGASVLLREELHPVFIDEFGTDLNNLPEDATIFDKLELVLSNYMRRTELPADDPNYFNFDEMLEKVMTLPKDKMELVFYMINEKPIERINAILALSYDFKDLNQKKGEQTDRLMVDGKAAMECLHTMFLYKYGSMYDATGTLRVNELYEFINEVLNDDFRVAPTRKIMSYIQAEAAGSLQDYVQLRWRQIKDTKMSAYVTGVVAEQSGDDISNRRHFAFTGYKLRHDPVIKTIMEHNTEIVRASVRGKFFSKINEDVAFGQAMVQVLDMIWVMYIDSEKMLKDGSVYKYPISFMAPENIKMKLNLEVTDQQIEAMKRANLLRRFVCTLEEYCRNSFNVYGDTISVECILVNAKIDPWYVTPLNEKNEFKIYNGQINLAGDVFIKKVLKEKYPSVYQQAVEGGGIISPSIKENYSQMALFETDSSRIVEKVAEEEVFKQVNIAEGKPERAAALPASMKDFYLSDDKYESVSQYLARMACEKSLVAGTGRKVKTIPLKNDFYFNSIMSLYDYNFGKEVVTVPSSEPIKFLEPAGAYTSNDIMRLTTKSNKIYELDIRSLELIGLHDYIQKGFEPAEFYYLGSSYVMFDGKPAIDLNTVTKSDMDKFCKDGNAIMLSSNRFLLRGVNRSAILEVV